MEFTPRAQNAFRLAEEEARRLGHPCVGSQHLLLGLFLLERGVQFSILRKLGFTTESLRQCIAAIGPVSEPTQAIGTFVFGVSATHTLERAAHEAETLSHTYTGTEHVLLGLLSERLGGAASVFAAHCADVAKGRQMILDEYAQV